MEGTTEEKNDVESLTDDLENVNLEKRAPLFEELAYENTFTEMESLCMNCHENGVTRILLIRIPHFKEVILMAFSCPHCNFRSNEVQYGGSIAEKGIRIELHAQKGGKELNRQIVKSDTATLIVPELDFEIPPHTQKGLLNTIEGFLSQSADALKADQDQRREIDKETAEKIDQFIDKLEKCASGDMEFTVIVDDPAGNSYIENPNAPLEDPLLKITHYKRTDEQNFAIGLTTDSAPEEEALKEYQSSANNNNNNNNNVDKKNWHFGTKGTIIEDQLEKFDYKNEVMQFPGNCSHCHAPSQTRMVVVEIPYFKEVVIMATTCDACGYKSNEVKGGGAIPDKGRRIILKVTDVEDLSRNILKSETATFKIPEFDIVVGPGSLGGRFTTLEGLLVGIKDDVSVNLFIHGDSANTDSKQRADQFFSTIDKMISGDIKFTLIMEDPVANSYIQNPYAPDPDPNMSYEDFDRTFEQNEELGLNDIKTEDY